MLRLKKGVIPDFPFPLTNLHLNHLTNPVGFTFKMYLKCNSLPPPPLGTWITAIAFSWSSYSRLSFPTTYLASSQPSCLKYSLSALNPRMTSRLRINAIVLYKAYNVLHNLPLLYKHIQFSGLISRPLPPSLNRLYCPQTSGCTCNMQALTSHLPLPQTGMLFP